MSGGISTWNVRFELNQPAVKLSARGGPKVIPEAVVERTMKVQEVILRAMAKRMSWWQAAEVVGISDRQMRRWRRRWEKFGYDGLLDRRRGRPSLQRVPLKLAERVLALYREKYFDFNGAPFSRKVAGATRHAAQLRLGEAGPARRGVDSPGASPGRASSPAAAPAPARYALASRRQFARPVRDDRRYDLLVVPDDATSEIYYAQLVEQESTRTVLAALREVVKKGPVLRPLQRSGQPFL
jgi:hypothetical protein